MTEILGFKENNDKAATILEIFESFIRNFFLKHRNDNYV